MANGVTAWAVNDFKALGDVRLALPQLTVLTGANSSGKSSTLQSLLMFGQTLARGGPTVLNGPLVRLGLPGDVVRDGQRSIQFAITTRIETSVSGEFTESPVEVHLSMAQNPEIGTLELVSLDIAHADGTVILSATSDRITSSDRDSFTPLVGDAFVFLRITQLNGKRAPNRMYLGCIGFLPVFLIAHKTRDHIARRVRDVLGAVITPSESLNSRTFEIIQELNQLVNRRAFYSQDPPDQTNRPDPVEPGLHDPQFIPRWNVRNLSQLSSKDKAALVELAASQRASTEWVVVTPGFSRYYPAPARRTAARLYAEFIMEDQLAEEHEIPLAYLASTAQALQEFGFSIRYLGPLRDEPRVVHSAWDERVESLPVGIRGELTAEVLTRQQTQRIRYRDWDNNVRTDLLPDAVAEWCKYFEIGDHIKVLDRGKLGRGVELRVNGIHRDLTTIGVGASQLLPVLVAGLTVGRGSVVLIEQPELHLHPLVQSRLADFFVFARDDVRFIVETHSEYLITRIRRRVAEASISPDKIQVLFADQRDGTTSVEPLELSELGDFHRWPAGFFDSQDLDSLSIVKAVSAKLGRGGI